MEGNSAASPKLYEQVALRLIGLIGQGTFRPGERIPSVRSLSQNQNISVTTVLEAYRLMESQGWIEARPQSGYFVRARSQAAPAEPEVTRPLQNPAEVSIGELAILVFRDILNPELLQLGAAMPSADLLPTQKLNRTMAAMARLHPRRSNGYDSPCGCRELRVQIARRAMEAGCALTPEEIVVTSGCQEAVVLALRATCRPGDTVALESPTYYGFLQAIEMLGLKALELPTHPRDGISLEALRNALDEHAIRACLVISNFNNPTGSCIPDDRKRELAELLAERDIPLIEDDISGDLCFARQRPHVAKSFDKTGNVLLCSSFSKTLAPGYRVGWIVPGRYQAEIERLKLLHNITTAPLPQLAIAEFLDNGGYDHYLRKVRRIYAQQLTTLLQTVAEAFPPGTRATRPAGGFAIWVEMPEGIDSLRLYERAKRQGMSFPPGPIFSAGGHYRNYLRLNAAKWSPEIESGIRILGAMAGELLAESKNRGSE